MATLIAIDDPAILNEVTITFKDQYQSHVHNETEITLKSLTLTCSPGGDAVRSGLYPPLKPGYGEDAYVQAGMQARAGERESSIVVSADSLHAGCSR